MASADNAPDQPVPDTASVIGSSPPPGANHDQQQPLPPKPEDFISSVAAKVASQPLQNSNPEVWGVLTAISANARKRKQGINMLFTSDGHCIGRMVPDVRFQIESLLVSGNHCKIYRKMDAVKDVEDQCKRNPPVFLKDTSTNGTYLNWNKLTKKGPEAELHHGDIVSFVGPPHLEGTLAFVYREVVQSTSVQDGSVKRKSEDLGSQSKKLKGIGIGAPEGPLSLDDFKSLQRSNTDLRKQLENDVLTIETLHNEKRAATELHQKEIKDLSKSVELSYSNQLEELKCLLEVKQKELEEVKKTLSEQNTVIIDLNGRLNVSTQSCAEADEIIKNQKVTLLELKAELDEEKDQRKQERENSAADLKAAVQKVLLEAKEELRQFSEVASRQEREQQELIKKHKESEKELSVLVETQRIKLEDHRQKLVASDNKVRQLEAEVSMERKVSADGRKKIEGLEEELKRLKEELQSEKSAREEAWAKVSNLELQINTAMHDLEYERRRLKGARERILLRETQLRAFYSTTEEISVLLVKQQEQLKSMQKTLEDEENYENTSMDFELNAVPASRLDHVLQKMQHTACQSNGTTKARSFSSAQRSGRNKIDIVSPEVSDTEKHECDGRTQECQNTQEVDSVTADPLMKTGFGSDINTDVGPGLDEHCAETELVMDTECQIGEECNTDLNKWERLGGETMRLDEQIHLEDPAPVTRDECLVDYHTDTLVTMEDTEAPDVIRTQDLLASEPIGSWACSTAPSEYDENNYSQKSRDNDNEGVDGLLALYNSNSPAESQNNEHYALSKMIRAAGPYLNIHFGGALADDHGLGTERSELGDHPDSVAVDSTHGDNEGHATISNLEVEDSENEDDNNSQHQATLETNRPDYNTQLGDAMDEDNEATQQVNS